VWSETVFESEADVAEHAIRSEVLLYPTEAPTCESDLPAYTCRIGYSKGLTDRVPFPRAAKQNTAETSERYGAR